MPVAELDGVILDALGSIGQLLQLWHGTIMAVVFSDLMNSKI